MRKIQTTKHRDRDIYSVGLNQPPLLHLASNIPQPYALKLLPGLQASGHVPAAKPIILYAAIQHLNRLRKGGSILRFAGNERQCAASAPGDIHTIQGQSIHRLGDLAIHQ